MDITQNITIENLQSVIDEHLEFGERISNLNSVPLNIVENLSNKNKMIRDFLLKTDFSNYKGSFFSLNTLIRLAYCGLYLDNNNISLYLKSYNLDDNKFIIEVYNLITGEIYEKILGNHETDIKINKENIIPKEKDLFFKNNDAHLEYYDISTETYHINDNFENIIFDENFNIFSRYYRLETSVRNLEFPVSSNIVIRRYAFSNQDLRTLIIPNKLYLEKGCFFRNENLTQINLSSIDVIPEYAFAHCRRLSKIQLSNCTKILNGAFINIGIGLDVEIHLSTQVTEISDTAFLERDMKPTMKSVTFFTTDMNNIIAEYCQKHNFNYKYDETIFFAKHIENFNVGGIVDLRGTNFKIIGENAFNGIYDVNKVILPDTINKISSLAFVNTGVEHLYIYNDNIEIEKNSFSNNDNITIYIHKNNDIIIYYCKENSISYKYIDFENSRVEITLENHSYFDDNCNDIF